MFDLIRKLVKMLWGRHGPNTEARQAANRAAEGMHDEIVRHRSVVKKIVDDENHDLMAVLVEDMRREGRAETRK